MSMVIVGTSIGWVLTTHIEKNTIEKAKVNTSKIIGGIAGYEFKEADLRTPKNGEDSYNEFGGKLSEIAAVEKGIFDITCWDDNFTVMWAVNKELIGKRFPGNKKISSALNGKTASTIEKLGAVGSEAKHIMKIYVPIHSGENIGGIFEVSQNIDLLYVQIRNEQIKLMSMLMSGFFAIYISLFWVMWHAAKGIKSASEELSEEGKKSEKDKTLSTQVEQEENSEEDTSNIIDKKAVLDYVGGEEKLFREIIDIFTKDSQKLLCQMQEAIKDEDSGKLERAAHSLKKSLSNLSARAAYDAAGKLETIGHSNENSDAEAAYINLEKEIDRLKPMLVLP